MLRLRVRSPSAPLGRFFSKKFAKRRSNAVLMSTHFNAVSTIKMAVRSFSKAALPWVAKLFPGERFFHARWVFSKVIFAEP